MTIEERFDAKWEPVTESGCWVWTASLHRVGYGQIRHDERILRAHRVSYELHIGPIPAGMHVLHKCDNRSCVNPDHLFLGTNDDNVADMVTKGRQSKGEKNGKARLTEDNVREIRRRLAAGEKNKDLSVEFGVSTPSISKIAKRKTWRHVE